MSSSERYACEKCPFFADEPLVVFDVVGVGEDGVQRQKWDSVQVGVPRNRYMETRSRNFRRVNGDGSPEVVRSVA